MVGWGSYAWRGYLVGYVCDRRVGWGDFCLFGVFSVFLWERFF